MSMLEKIKGWAEQLAREAMPVDPAKFNDPAALRTQWTPLVNGGSNFRTHRLAEVGPNRFGLKAAIGLYLFGGLFLVVGLAIIAHGAITRIWPLCLFGLPFAAIGAALLWPRPVVFDAGTRQFSTRKRTIAFSAIQAVQIVRESVRGKNSTFYSYEVNLVLADGDRVNVMDHGDLGGVRTDAERIRSLVGCKLWDGSVS